MPNDITAADLFVGLAAKYNHYQESDQHNPDHSCHTCLRRQFSYPYTCNDGWPCGDPGWQDRGVNCLNWTDQGNAPA
jgi:hypothetical protein